MQFRRIYIDDPNKKKNLIGFLHTLTRSAATLRIALSVWNVGIKLVPSYAENHAKRNTCVSLHYPFLSRSLNFSLSLCVCLRARARARVYIMQPRAMKRTAS